jgi:hypothetical protein
MKGQLGRRPERFLLPEGDGDFWFELKKLSGPLKSDYRALQSEGARPSVQARFIWDRACVGFRIPNDEPPVLAWPGGKANKDDGFDALDEDMLMYLLFAFWTQNGLCSEGRTAVYRAALKVGLEGLPVELQAVLVGDSEPTPEAVEMAERVVAGGFGDPPARGEEDTLGNVPGSSDTSSGPESSVESGG